MNKLNLAISFIKKINKSKEFTSISDLVAFYKMPYSLFQVGEVDFSYRVLKKIKREYWSENHFKSYPDKKSFCPYMNEFESYMDGWLIVGALFHNDLEIVINNYNFLLKLYYTEGIGFKTNENKNEYDLITLAHLGYVSLFTNNLKIAKECADSIQVILESNSEKNSKFYLRINESGEPIVSWEKDRNSKFYVVDKSQENQDYFHLGYGSLFLSVLYTITKEKKYKKLAKSALEQAFDCQKDVFTKLNSGKVMIAAAYYSIVAEDDKFWNLSEEIARNLMNVQSSKGAWLMEPFDKGDSRNLAYTLDITTENLLWLSAFYKYKQYREKHK